MSSYSTRPLIDKLGVKPGMRAIVMRAPAGYMDLLAGLGERANVATRLAGRFDFVQYFATSVEQLGAVMPNLALHLEPGGMLWVSWQKGKMADTGLDENVVRKLGVDAGLVDVKVAAIDGEWSGLKFVYRVADR